MREGAGARGGESSSSKKARTTKETGKAGAVEAWSSALSAAALVATGSLAAVGWARVARDGAREPARAARYFAADRDAGEVVALDEDFLVVRRFAVDSPLEV